METTSSVLAAIAEGSGSPARHFTPTAKALPRRAGEVAIQGALPQGDPGIGSGSRSRDRRRPALDSSGRTTTPCLYYSRRPRTLCSIGLDELARHKQEARRGPLRPAQYKMVEGLAKQGFPGAQELLQKCSQVARKERKRFAEIVRETPRQEGETAICWVRRIWDQCDKYETNCPTVITERLLEKCSRSGAPNHSNNLPVISAERAKSFRTQQGKTPATWQLR